MSISLADALQQVNLEPGTYHFRLEGHDVEVRVVKRSASEVVTAAKYDEADVMLDPWVELPTPKPVGTVLAHPAPPPPPDIPEIPSEDDLP